MRRIAVVTVGRSDLGIYLPVLAAIRADPDLELCVIASGAHLSPTFGWTVRDLQTHGFQVAEQVDMLLSADNPQGIGKSIGLGVIGFAQAYQRLRPDILLVLGDRFEMLAATVAAVPFTIPLAHIHGGEVTEGAMDESFRHAITKCSHLHFVAAEDFRRRVVQLGEEPWRVTVSGAPALDNLRSLTIMTRQELQETLRIPLNQAPLLVTFHPETLRYRETADHLAQLLLALDAVELPVIFTLPNADTSCAYIIERIHEFARGHANVSVVDSLGTQRYFSLMRIAAAIVGNSSSGIIEAASFQLPVVNIGDRQKGRLRAQNVIDVGYSADEITASIRKAIDLKFRNSLRDLKNPYGDGHAAQRILSRLKTIEIDQRLLQKKFHDLHAGSCTQEGHEGQATVVIR